MKKKTKIILTASMLTIFSLTVTAYHRQSQIPPKQPDSRPVSALTESSRDNTPPTESKAVVSDEYCLSIRPLVPTFRPLIA